MNNIISIIKQRRDFKDFVNKLNVKFANPVLELSFNVDENTNNKLIAHYLNNESVFVYDNNKLLFIKNKKYKYSFEEFETQMKTWIENITIQKYTSEKEYYEKKIEEYFETFAKEFDVCYINDELFINTRKYNVVVNTDLEVSCEETNAPFSIMNDISTITGTFKIKQINANDKLETKMEELNVPDTEFISAKELFDYCKSLEE